MTKELKEREQENRISKLKIKEMKRLIKHNQLKPLSQMTASENNESVAKKGTSVEKKKKDKSAKKHPKEPQWSLQDELMNEPSKEIYLKLADK